MTDPPPMSAHGVQTQNTCDGLGMSPRGALRMADGTVRHRWCAHEHASHAECDTCGQVFNLAHGARIRIHFERDHGMPARTVLDRFNGGEAGRERVEALIRSSRNPWRRAPSTKACKIPDKIRTRIEIDEKGCWIWQGSRNIAGYGLVSFDGKSRLVHRMVKRIEHGPIPATLHVCHRCDVPACCNPEHLFVGTPGENARDCRNKGRGRSKLTAPQVVEIRARHKAGASMSELARDYGVSRQAIALIVTGKTWVGV